MAERFPRVSAGELVAILDQEIASMAADEVAALARAYRPQLVAFLTNLWRDRRFLELMLPDQLTFEPDLSLASVDLESAELTGVDETVDALLADLPKHWNELRTLWLARPERLRISQDPLSAFRAFVTCIRELLERDPGGRRAAALLPMLALAEWWVELADAGRAPSLLPTEILAAAAGPTGASARRDAQTAGAGSSGVQALGGAGWLDRFEAAAHQTEEAARPDLGQPSLAGHGARLEALGRQTRSAIHEEIRAEVPEGEQRLIAARRRRRAQLEAELWREPSVGGPAIRTGRVSKDALEETLLREMLQEKVRELSIDAASPPPLPDFAVNTEEEAVARLEAEQLWAAIRSAKLSTAELELLVAIGQGETAAEIARRLGISPDSARQRVHRARKKIPPVSGTT